ncbi:MAG: hypothetical protein HGB11_14950, partial [Chlorobiales bacterium]|nr:hypothetical protein [Chlorobiales bacterium]
MSAKTVFIIGAGASAEAGLPTGKELRDKIAGLLDMDQPTGDDIILNAISVFYNLGFIIQKSHEEINKHLIAARHIRDAMPQALSIDNFIDNHRGNKEIEFCGKLSIVRSILQAEQGSTLYPQTDNRRLDFRALENTWFNRFVQILTENSREEDLEERLEKICLVVFNYDRCIEHFVFHALQNYYHISEQETAELINNHLEIYHPYGQVGYLPWQAPEKSIEKAGEKPWLVNSIGFGGEPNSEGLKQLASQIRTFTEGTSEETSNIDELKTRINESKMLIFLGFAFHELNLKLLGSDKTENNKK